MADRDLELALRLRADVTKALKEFDKATSSIEKQGNAAKKASEQHGAMEKGMRRLAAAATAYFTLQGAVHLLREADAYKQLQARIKIATQATGDYNKVSAELSRISKENGVALESSVGLFQSLARTAPELGVTNKQVIRLADSVQKLGAISGTSRANMQAGLMQFSQAMAAGVVRAEEFNSILENIPELANRIAQGMGKTVGQLRQMVLDGELLSKDVFAAIEKQAGEIDEQFSNIPISLDRATQTLLQSWDELINRLNEAGGITDFFVSRLLGLAKVLDHLGGSGAAALDPEGQDNVAHALTEQYEKLNDELDDLLEKKQKYNMITFEKDEARIKAIREEMARLKAQIEEIYALREKPTDYQDFVGGVEEAANAIIADVFSGAGGGVDKEAEARQKSIQSIIDKLKEEAATYGMSAQEIAVWRLQQQGASNDTIQLAKALQQQIEEQQALDDMLEEASKENEENEKQADARRKKDLAFIKALEKAQDPLAAYREEHEFLEELLKRFPEHAETIEKAIDDLSEKYDENAKLMASFTKRTASEIHSLLGDTLYKGLKGDFDDIAGAWEDMLLRMVAEATAMKMSNALFGDMFTGGNTGSDGLIGGFLSDLVGSLFHGGGIAGQGTTARAVSPLVFAGAPRYHGGGLAGLRSDEVPAILQKGEGVFTPEQMAAMGSGPKEVRVEIVNNGTPQEVQQAKPKMDAEKMIIQVITQDIRRGGPLANTIAGTYNLSRGGS